MGLLVVCAWRFTPKIPPMTPYFTEPRRRTSNPTTPGDAPILGGTFVLGVSVLGPVRDTLLGSLLALLSAGLLIIGTLLGVLVGMLRVLEATEAEVHGDDQLS